MEKCDPGPVTHFLRNPSGYWLRDWHEMQRRFSHGYFLLTFRFKCLKNNITWQNKLLWKIVLQLQKRQNFHPYFYSRICIHLTKKHPPHFLLAEGKEGNGTEGDRSERCRKKSSSWEKYPPVPSTSAGTNKKENASGDGRNWVKKSGGVHLRSLLSQSLQVYTLFFYQNIFSKNIEAEIDKILRIFWE